jgi:hypothetical protein
MDGRANVAKEIREGLFDPSLDENGQVCMGLHCHNPQGHFAISCSGKNHRPPLTKTSANAIKDAANKERVFIGQRSFWHQY